LPRDRDYRYWLYDHQFDDSGAFLDNLRNLVKNTGIKINILMIASQVDLRHEFRSWSPEHYTVTAKNSLPVFSIDVEKEFEKRDPERARAAIVKYSEDLPLYLIVSDCTAVTFKELFTRLVYKHYPNIARIFLTNTEMRMIFESVQESTGTRIHVDSSIAKRRILSEKKFKESLVRYTDTPFEEEFDDVDALGAWIQSIKFTARKLSEANVETPEENFSGIISRGCFFSCHGDFSPFIQTIIPKAIRFASTRMEYLRARAETAPQRKPDPVVIHFNEDIFADARMNKQYVDALAQLESVSVSQYHSNPYMHLSLLDYLDGSSYDVWVISSNRMMIIPEIEASTASLSRLVNHVYERIHEGQVEVYAQVASSSQSG
jgi:hypothetical protein